MRFCLIALLCLLAGCASQPTKPAAGQAILFEGATLIRKAAASP